MYQHISIYILSLLNGHLISVIQLHMVQGVVMNHKNITESMVPAMKNMALQYIYMYNSDNRNMLFQ